MAAQKYFFDEHKDRLIREAYSSPEVQRRNGPIKRLARNLGIPRGIVLRRARALGLNPRVARCGTRWTAAEDAIIERHAWKTPDTISRHLHKAGFDRSPTAVQLRLTRVVGISRAEAREEHGMLKANEAARLLGVEVRTLTRMIERGDLRGQRVDGRSDGRPNYYLIRDRDIRQALIDHTAHFNFARIDKYWLVDLLTGNTGIKGGAA